MKTKIFIIISLIIAFTTNNLFSQNTNDRINAFNKQITSYKKDKSKLEKKRDKGEGDYNALVVEIHSVDSMIKVLTVKRDELIMNPQGTNINVSSEDHQSLADRQKKKIGKTGWLAKKLMLNTMDIDRQQDRDNYRKEVLKQRTSNGGCGSEIKNGILYYTASSHSYWYNNSYDHPAAEFIINEIDANGRVLVGVPERRATLYLQDGPTHYSLPDGRYRGQIYIGKDLVWEKTFEVNFGEKSANYRGQDFEFKLGCDVQRF